MKRVTVLRDDDTKGHVRFRHQSATLLGIPGVFYAEQNPETTLSCALIYVATFRAAIEVCGDRGLRPALESLRARKAGGWERLYRTLRAARFFSLVRASCNNAQRTQPLEGGQAEANQDVKLPALGVDLSIVIA